MTPRRSSHTAFRLLALATALVIGEARPSRGQAPPPRIDQQIQNDRPKFLVRVSVDKEYRIYGEGETLKLNVRCEEDAYLYVLYQQADGKIFQIFPNSGQPDNRVKGKQDIHVPDLDDAFRWVVGPPFGHEVVKVIASKKPVDALSLPGLKEDRFNPVGDQQMQGAGQQLSKEPANVWSEHDVAIQTVRKGVPTTPPEAHKRFGVFFGVSKYEFHDVKVAAYGPDARMNLTLAENDAADMSHVLQQVGRLTDAHVYKNEQATRERMREEITEWLPSVSRPGDTVFIYFSGHGFSVADDDNDEEDGTDEVLATHDTFQSDVFVALLKLRKQGKLAPQWEALVNRLGPQWARIAEQTYAAAGGDGNKDEANRKAIEQGSAFLARSTGVSDDEMAHWVQKLDGRHVVVIADACRSGGLVARRPSGDKGLDGPGRVRAAGFNFLRGSFNRLKDLDQRALTLLAAASDKQNSIEFEKMRNGLFTAAILELLTRSSKPVDVHQAWEYSSDTIATILNKRKEYRKAHNLPEEPGFKPEYYSTEPTPIVLKPAP